MAENIVRICRLCLNIIGDTNFELLESYRAEMLKTILVSLDMSISLNPIICCKCADTLQKYFEFKMTCLRSEDIVKTYINISEPVKVKLENICLKELLKDGESCNGQKICRLCFSLDGEFYTDVNDTSDDGPIRDMLKCCLPELNLDLTTDTSMCKECLDLLRRQFTFTSDCLESEQKIKTFCNLKGNNSSNIIDLWSILKFYNKIKSENNVETVTVKLENATCDIPERVSVKVESNCDIIKNEELDMPEDMEVKDEYSTENEQREREEENTSLPECNDKQSNDHNVKSNEEQTLHCPECPYIAEDPKRFNLHSLQHKDAAKKTKFPCDLCEYLTTRRTDLRKHMMVHADIPVDKLLMCHICEFRCKRKSNLKAHKLRAHGSKGDPAKMFKCRGCDFQSKTKNCLRDHMLLHTSTNSLYKCKECNYMTNHSRSLRRHARTHKDVSEVEIFKCTECNFQTKWKCSLKNHFVLQHDPFKITYNCDICDYSTSTFRYLEKHAETHKDI